jgi:uncharacterized DUF497 family protein
MRFEWDAAKASANRAKHGVTFEEAITAFDDAFALVAPDLVHSIGEERRWLIGAGDRRVLVVVFTIRQTDVYRLISARPASRRERQRYEEAKRVPL